MKHKAHSLFVLSVLAAGLVLLLGGCFLSADGVDFGAEPRAGEAPLTVTFSPLVEGDVVSWLWNFGDGTTSTAQNPEHTYTDEGTYSVTLTVESRWGLPVSTTKPSHVTVISRDMVAAPIFITFFNESDDPDQLTVFVFAKNAIPTFDELTDGVAWRVLSDVAQGASTLLIYPLATTVQAMWGACNVTRSLRAETGKRYTVEEDATGIVLVPSGSASQPNATEVGSLVHVDGGITAQLLRDDRVILQKTIVAYDQKATFVSEPKLYWGIASEIQEGQAISSAVLVTDTFFEHDLDGVSQATITLTGDSASGYQFTVENGS